MKFTNDELIVMWLLTNNYLITKAVKLNPDAPKVRNVEIVTESLWKRMNEKLVSLGIKHKRDWVSQKFKRELTIAEIEKELGYPIKIVKEK